MGHGAGHPKRGPGSGLVGARRKQRDQGPVFHECGPRLPYSSPQATVGRDGPPLGAGAGRSRTAVTVEVRAPACML